MSAASARGKIGSKVASGVFGTVVAAFLLAPIATIAAASLSSADYMMFPPSLPLSGRWYRAFLEDDLYFAAFKNSLSVAVIVAVAAVSIGTCAAMGLMKSSFPGEKILHNLIMLPFLVPGIVLGIGIAASLRPLGLEGLRGSLTVIALGHLLWATPLAFLVMLAKLRSLDDDLTAAALSLGASPWRVAKEVTIPLLLPAVFASAMLAFVISLHDFPVALFLVSADTTTLPVLTWNSLRFEVRPIIAASDTVMVGFVVIALGLLGRVFGLDRVTSQ